jgi:hypothetical protein
MNKKILIIVLVACIGVILAIYAMLMRPTFVDYVVVPEHCGRFDRENRRNRRNTISTFESYDLYMRLNKKDKHPNENPGCAMWENWKYFYYEDLPNSTTIRTRSPSTNAFQIRKTDGKWRRYTNEWQSAGYVHLKGNELIAGIRQCKVLDELEKRYGPAIRDEYPSVVIQIGERTPDGIIATNGIIIANSDKYQLLRYECINATVDIIISGNRIMWCARSKGGRL